MPEWLLGRFMQYCCQSGNQTSEQRKAFALVKEALDIAISEIHPGVKAKKIDSLMRSHIGNFPHHGGHGVGTMYHEEPRITPYNEMELANRIW